jgi:hypothetical protein
MSEESQQEEPEQEEKGCFASGGFFECRICDTQEEAETYVGNYLIPEDEEEDEYNADDDYPT